MNTNAICTAIADRVLVNDLVILDLSEIPDQVIIRGTDCYLMPNAFGLISNLQVQRHSFGKNPVYTRGYKYRINYLLYYAPFGSGRGLVSILDGMVSKAVEAVAVINATNFIDVGAQTLTATVIGTDQIQDSARNLFHGCTIGVDVWELPQAGGY